MCAASVSPEPGSNSQIKYFTDVYLSDLVLYFEFLSYSWFYLYFSYECNFLLAWFSLTLIVYFSMYFLLSVWQLLYYTKCIIVCQQLFEKYFCFIFPAILLFRKFCWLLSTFSMITFSNLFVNIFFKYFFEYFFQCFYSFFSFLFSCFLTIFFNELIFFFKVLFDQVQLSTASCS